MIHNKLSGKFIQGVLHPGAWTYSLLAVFVFGVSTVVITRILLYVYHPEYFMHTPGITKAAAFAPGSYIFSAGMTVVSACTVIAWVLIFKLNIRKIDLAHLGVVKSTLCRILNICACIFGITAGICLDYQVISRWKKTRFFILIIPNISSFSRHYHSSLILSVYQSYAAALLQNLLMIMPITPGPLFVSLFSWMPFFSCSCLKTGTARYSTAGNSHNNHISLPSILSRFFHFPMLLHISLK
jgi:hypothetical protein